MTEQKHVKSVKEYKLKNDIRLYKRLKSKSLSQSRYSRIKHLEDKAEDIFHRFKTDNIVINADEQKTFAEYIDAFGLGRRDELLDKLQSQASFDVHKYIDNSRRKWWQKLFNTNSTKSQYLSAKELYSKTKEYKKLLKKLSKNWYQNPKLYDKQLVLEREAEKYAQKFLNGEIAVKQNDVEALTAYFRAFSHTTYDNSIYEQAYRRLRVTPLEEFEKSEKNNRFANLFRFKKLHFSLPKFSMPKISMPHFSLPKFSMPKVAYKPQLSAANKRNFKRAAGVTGVAVLLSGLTLGGMKSDNNANDKKTDKVEQNAQPKHQNLEQSKTFVWGQNIEQSNTFDWSSYQANNTPEKKVQEYTSEQKIWANFYSTKSEMQANELHLNVSDLNAKIQEQADKGIFTMPENTISEQLVYTHIMYKAYGLPSPIDNVLTAKQKLSDVQQKSVEQAIATAGQNGMGVKKIAQSIAAKQGRTLSNHSAYNHASKQQKQKYVSNLKIVRALSHNAR